MEQTCSITAIFEADQGSQQTIIEKTGTVMGTNHLMT